MQCVQGTTAVHGTRALLQFLLVRNKAKMQGFMENLCSHGLQKWIGICFTLKKQNKKF